MKLSSSKIESGLKSLLSKRTLAVRPTVGIYSWIFIAKSKFTYNDQPIYKMGHSGRIEEHLKKIKNDNNFVAEKPIIIEVRNGAGYFTKVLRRIFKPNKAMPEVGGRDWFLLNSNEIDWLNSIRLCDSFGLESEVADLLGANKLSTLNKEGLGS